MSLAESDSDSSAAEEPEQPRFRVPTATDGARVWELVAACPPLDRNSVYCNLIQCTDFARTCVLAEVNTRAVGWISAHRLPEDRRTLFVWQVAVREQARRSGLGRAMIDALLARSTARDVTGIRTTVTLGNEASWALFRSIARHRSAPLVSEAWFERNRHFGGRRDTEYLVSIGPFGALAAR